MNINLNNLIEIKNYGNELLVNVKQKTNKEKEMEAIKDIFNKSFKSIVDSLNKVKDYSGVQKSTILKDIKKNLQGIETVWTNVQELTKNHSNEFRNFSNKLFEICKKDLKKIEQIEKEDKLIKHIKKADAVKFLDAAEDLNFILKSLDDKRRITVKDKKLRVVKKGIIPKKSINKAGAEIALRILLDAQEAGASVKKQIEILRRNQDFRDLLMKKDLLEGQFDILRGVEILKSNLPLHFTKHDKAVIQESLENILRTVKAGGSVVAAMMIAENNPAFKKLLEYPQVKVDFYSMVISRRFRV